MTVLDKFRLNNRIVLITGASSGLGVAFAVAVAEAGADVVIAARRADRLQQTAAAVEETGRSCLAVPTDVSDPDACLALVAAAVQRFGRVDALVNNAGTGTAVPASRETVDEFRSVIDLNLSGCYWMAQACGRVTQPGSSIVNVSSILAITTAGLPQAAYSASKAGLLGLTRDLAQQWGGRKGIRVNALAPGFYAGHSAHCARSARRSGRPRSHFGVVDIAGGQLRDRPDDCRGRRRHTHLISQDATHHGARCGWKRSSAARRRS